MIPGGRMDRKMDRKIDRRTADRNLACPQFPLYNKDRDCSVQNRINTEKMKDRNGGMCLGG